ncbi:MAG: hypothetical protein HOY76_24855 [Streptomyces sp.]|nr:hypothetical protein [Streptomyces sp.]
MRPFALKDVALGDGLFAGKRRLMLDYGRGYNVVFGGTSSGVANPVKPDGTTLLDEIWAAAPFATKAGLVRQVAATVDTWVTAGLLGRAEGQAVVRTAREASYTP